MEKHVFKSYIHDYIKLFSYYLNNKKSEDFELDDDKLSFFVKLSKYHSLTALLYKAIKDTKVNIKEEDLKKLEDFYLLNLRKSLAFDKERKALYDFFNEKEIDFLPLKGLVIKEYYPDPNSREFADNDILFSSKDDEIKKFFIDRGYEVESFRKGNHDVYLKEPFYNFEIHRSLFLKDDIRIQNISYFDDYLNKTLIKQGHERYLKDEDFYVYFTAHTYKHFNVSGCGIRTLIDYYLFFKKSNLDFEYINKELNILNLVDFSNKMKELSIKAFDNQELSDDEEEMLLYIASSGTYGTMEHAVDKGIKEKGKFGYFMSRIFPPISFYKTAYPWAYKCKILIPIAWFARLIRILFKNPKKAATEINTIRKSKQTKDK